PLVPASILVSLLLRERPAMRPPRCVIPLLVAVIGCQPPKPADTSAAAKQAIDANNAAWERLTAAGHADSIADFYQSTALLLPPNMSPVHGRDSIRAFFGSMNGMSSPPPVHTLRGDIAWTSHPIAEDFGSL